MVEKIFAKEVSREMSISIMFVIANIYTDRFISIHKIWDSHKMKYCSALERNKLEVLAS